MTNTLDWGDYNFLTAQIEQAQAATVRITRSTAVMISERYAITAAHSPLDENNEITPDLTVQNLWGEVRNITNVFYDVTADFAIVELESPFDNSYAVKLADTPGQPGDQAFIVGHPWTVANSGVGWAVAFGTAYPQDVNSTDPGWSSFDIDVQGGFSGSGIYNEAGELLAILSVSYLDQDKIESPYFKQELPFQNEFWDIRNGYWAAGPGLDYIKAFMASEGIENIPAFTESLPFNEPDLVKEQYLSDEELDTALHLSSMDRLSNVLVSDAGAEEKAAYQFAGGGSGTLIHDSLILTVGHALDGRRELSIGAYNGQLDPNARFWALSKFGDLGLVKADLALTSLLPEQEVAATDVWPGEGAYHIGSPRQFWFSEGGWWSVGARALGNGIYSSVSSGGMSGGGIYDLNSNIVGVTSTGFGAPSGALAELNDRQDPHQTSYNPTLTDADSRVGTTDFFYLKQFVSEYSPSSIATDSSDWFAVSAVQIGTAIFEAGWQTDVGKTNTLYLKRYNEQGLVDSNFGSFGILDIELGDGSFTPAELLKFSDHLYVVGTHNFNQFESLFVARLDLDGALDTSFGQDGLILISHDSSQHANGAAIGDDGAIYVAGTRNADTTEAFVFKLTDGLADQTFGNSGYAMNVNAISSDIASDMALNDDGNVFLLTITDQSGGWDYGLTAFDNLGQVDASFGDGGQVIADYKNEFETANKLIIVDDGIVISGFSWAGADENPLLFKYTFDGSLDSNFGDGGSSYINIDNGGNNFLTDLRVDGDELSLLLSGTRRIQANEAWGDVIEGSYTVKTLNISSSGQVIPESGQTLNLKGNQVSYAVGFVDGSDGLILRQTPSQDGFATSLLLANDPSFSNIISLSGLYIEGETPSIFEGSELDDMIDSRNLDPVTLFGLAGDDLLAAWGVDDKGTGSTLYGGLGNDRLYGTSGADQLYGGSGFDHFSGQAGDDIFYVDASFEGAELHGGPGFDVAFVPGDLLDYYIWGTSSANFLVSKSDPSLMIQSFDMEHFIFDDSDVLTTQIESFTDLPQVASWEINLHDYLDNLVLTEFAGDLVIKAGVAHNYIFVGSGNDHISTGFGDDRIFAGDGNDILIGGHGSDVLNGSAGFDVAVIAGSRDAYVVQQLSETDMTLTHRSTGEIDILSGIELISFDDKYLVLDKLPQSSFTLQGDQSVGGTLSVTGSLVAGIELTPNGYQWLRDGTPISGADGATYTITENDQSKRIGVKLTFDGVQGAITHTVSGATVGEVQTDSDIRSFSFNVYIPDDASSPKIFATVGLADDFVSATFVYRIEGETERRFELDYSDIEGVFEATVALPENQISGEYITSFLELVDRNGESYLVQESMLNALGFETRQVFENPNGDSSEPLLGGLAVSITDDHGHRAAQLTGYFIPTGSADFVSEAEAFITIPNSTDTYKAPVSVDADGSFSGVFNFSDYAASGEYAIVGLFVEMESGERASWDFHNSEYTFVLDNPNQDTEAPKLDGLNFYAVFDENTQRPVLIIEGAASDQLSGIDNVFVRILGEQNTDYIGIDYPLNPNLQVDSFDFRIEMPMLSEFLPGVYSIEVLSLYDRADNWSQLNEQFLSDVGYSPAISVFYPVSDDIFEVTGSNYNDFVFGTDLNSDTLFGAGGDDILYAGNGNDLVDAGDGDDLIIGGSGLGDDFYTGGDGVDTINYISATAGIRVNLIEGVASSIESDDMAGIGKDILIGIENVIGGNFDDTLMGNLLDNRFEGLGGNDRFELGLGKNFSDGGNGNDTIILEGGGTFSSGFVAFNISSELQTGTEERINLNGKTRFEDVMDGGADIDTIELTDASDAFFLHDSFSGFHSSLTLSDDYSGNSGTARIENIENINAGGGDDIVDLTSTDYSLDSQNITVNGGEGSDTLWGSDADETLIGGADNDVLFGGAGVNELIGGSGADEFQFTKTSTNDTVADFNISDGDTLKFFNTGGAVFDRESIALNSAGDELSIAYGSGVDDALTISLMNAGLQLDELTSDVLIIV